MRPVKERFSLEAGIEVRERGWEVGIEERERKRGRGREREKERAGREGGRERVSVSIIHHPYLFY